jgi:large subunit ribosomal protein L25
LSKGGVLIRDHMEIEISAKPTAIPENLPVKIAHLDIGDRLLLNEIALPDGVTLSMDPDTVVCHVVEAKAAEVPEATAATPAEGEAVPAAKAEESDKGKDDDKKK